ncbi:hypothetical protein QCD71_24725, partial [Sphingomonas sp. PsM26]|nr:hypothetical protein [Sphingomonas sp. PsM26]
ASMASEHNLRHLAGRARDIGSQLSNVGDRKVISDYANELDAKAETLRIKSSRQSADKLLL